MRGRKSQQPLRFVRGHSAPVPLLLSPDIFYCRKITSDQLVGGLAYRAGRGADVDHFMTRKLGFQHQPAGHRGVPTIDVTPEPAEFCLRVFLSLLDLIKGRLEADPRQPEACDGYLRMTGESLGDLFPGNLGQPVGVLQPARMALVQG
jgi:hypothetical protein